MSDGTGSGAGAMALLDAANRLLTREGVSALTMDAIAEEAAVDRRELERHFPTRGVLLNELCARSLSNDADEITAEIEPTKSGEEALDTLIRAFTSQGLDRIEEFRLTRLGMQMFPEMTRELERETLGRIFASVNRPYTPVEARLIADWGTDTLPNGVQPRQLAFLAGILAQGFVLIKGLQEATQEAESVHRDDELIDLMSRVMCSPPRTMRQLAALNRASRELARMRTEKELLERVPQLLTGTLDFDRASLLMDVEGELSPVASAWPSDEERDRVHALLTRWRPTPPPHYRRALEQDATLHLPDPSTDPDWPQPAMPEDAEALATLHWNAPMVITPVRVGGVPVGVITGHAHIRWRAMDAEDISRVETFAAMVGIALENVRMLENLNAMVDERTRELRDAQTALVQSEKMASMGQLVAGVAHELNTPVGAVGSAQDSMRKAAGKLGALLGADRGRRVDAMLKVIVDSAEVVEAGTDRIDAIVTRLRSFARLDEASRKPTDLHVCIDDAIALSAHSRPPGVIIERSFGELPELVCDPRKLNQLFTNLLTNAVHAVSGEGRVCITTEADAETIRVTITDDGLGIPKEQLGRVFDPGFTTKGVGVGTGLGLSIVYRIVEEHAGSIDVESTEGEGTSVHVRFPAT